MLKKLLKIIATLLLLTVVFAGGLFFSPTLGGWVVSMVIPDIWQEQITPMPEIPRFGTPSIRLAEHMQGDIYFQTRTPYDFSVILQDYQKAAPTVGFGQLLLPEGASAHKPVPAMVLVHGSGGNVRGRENTYAKMLNQMGVAAFVLDYYKPRGITKDTSYIVGVLAVTEFDALADAYEALNLLSTHPAIDKDKIGVMGFSYGGMTVKAAIDERVRKRLSPESTGFAVFVDFYGPCFQNFQTSNVNGAPLLTLRGTEDKSNDLEACEKLEAHYRDLGIEVETHVFEGAGHAWEHEGLPAAIGDYPYFAGCEIVYDEQGFASMNGKPVSFFSAEVPRSQRIALRLKHGAAMRHCVGKGYKIGYDQMTRQKSDQQFTDFIQRKLLGSQHAP